MGATSPEREKQLLMICLIGPKPISTCKRTLTIKLDKHWSRFQLANSAPPLRATKSAIAPYARMPVKSEDRFPAYAQLLIVQ
jgi:hypothetical protein